MFFWKLICLVGVTGVPLPLLPSDGLCDKLVWNSGRLREKEIDYLRLEFCSSLPTLPLRFKTAS